ncbi:MULTISPECIES: cell wall hydrolase [unclassified Candidatus Frackibacter]|uniref:cell wall hydrolase n=1 Tax=unclassified Candidatus Frackibacter TaxID=2648818 RepID=UPI0008802A2D|nr:MULTISPECIES: cell wall hydrolase [unclassified Candidatus Frackibacter]SDC75255.1 N-acetylmuramoyl-L-alanine amidase [Candidatus Frackibacter sp. WG11]SEM89003.1 N-acetylmuramoyl-L-alanine amidase [Candidatus Frackibacter sp. WG12]SFL98450.1 N-acetylmuramoyl-L-alanine amidase [Candidatus Frackibacter sp. WG13]
MKQASKYNKLLLILVLVLLFSLFVEEDQAQANEKYNLELGARTLRYGDEGVDVAFLQIQLKVLGLYHGEIDGLFGRATLKAVRFFQARNGLKPDGIVGEGTLQYLQTGNYANLNTFSRKLVLTLARAINGEARGESFRGQVAVGAVILNRVLSHKFPNTVRKVIYQKGQFTSVADGQVNLYPTKSSIIAAKAALLGYDPTGHALFFYNPRIATKTKWISSRPVVVKIDNHIFAN